MLFVLNARFNPGVEAVRQAIHERFNEHLMQRASRVRYGGPLFDDQGARTGVLLIVEAADLEAARRFVSDSPYEQAGLYESVQISELRPEVGGLG